MKLHHKAMLFSLFVFPGAGYFVLGEKVRGGVAVISSLAVLVVLTVEFHAKSLVVSRKLVNGEIPINFDVIRHEIMTAPGTFDSGLVVFLSWGFLVVLLVSLLDCYRLGRKLDAN